MTSRDSPKLSLLATFDDQARVLQSFIESLDDNFNGPISMFHDYEKNRKRWLVSNQELTERNKQIDELNKENQELKIRLESVRRAYTREVKEKNQLQNEYNELRKKLLMVQDLLNEERDTHARSASVLSVLSDLNKVQSSDNKNASESDDGLLFDKSDATLEDMDTDDHQTQISMRRSIEPANAKFEFDKKAPSMTLLVSTSSAQSPQTPSSAQPLYQKPPSTIIEEAEDDESILNVGFSIEKSPVKADHQDDTGFFSSTPAPSIKSPINCNSPQLASLTKTVSTTSVNRRKSSKLMTKFNLMRKSSKLDLERLDSRSHSFQPKKTFKPMNCSACNKNIGFCSNCFICADCRGIVHPRCQKELPKPCIPYVASGAGLKKMLSSGHFSGTHMVTISDFTTPDARPFVPALMIHCCNELDRRIDFALKDPKVGTNSSSVVGMYRVKPGNEREVRELRGRILEAKCGLPNLSTVTDPHVICGVVKSFLRDLDDPLVTRILWNDFVRAAESVEEIAKENGIMDRDHDAAVDENLDSANDDFHESLQVLKGVIIQLPNANRDTLAFLFIHFHHVIDFQSVTRMGALELSQIFAPTIVGSSVHHLGPLRPSNGDKLLAMSNAAMNENTKKLSVMQALFRLSLNFWNSLLKDPTFCPFG